MAGDEFAGLLGGGGAGLDGGADAAHVTADDGCYQPAADLYALDNCHVGGLGHGVRGLDEGYEPFGFQ